MDRSSFALLFSVLLFVYHQVTTWVSLFPWNDVHQYSRKELFLEGGFNGFVMALNIYCLGMGNSGFFHWYPLIYLPFLLVGECVDWWIPYFSRSFAEKRKIWNYDAKFARTLKLIPHRSGKGRRMHIITIMKTILIFWDRLI